MPLGTMSHVLCFVVVSCDRLCETETVVLVAALAENPHVMIVARSTSFAPAVWDRRLVPVLLVGSNTRLWLQTLRDKR